MASVKVEKKDLSSEFPRWFKPEPGFKFRDSDGDPCIVVGWGGWRKDELVNHDTPFGSLSGFQLKFCPCALVYAYCYKGEWHLNALDPTDDLQGIKSGWTSDMLDERSGWK